MNTARVISSEISFSNDFIPNQATTKLYEMYKDGYSDATHFIGCKAKTYAQLRAWSMGFKDGENRSFKTLDIFLNTFK